MLLGALVLLLLAMADRLGRRSGTLLCRSACRSTGVEIERRCGGGLLVVGHCKEESSHEGAGLELSYV